MAKRISELRTINKAGNTSREYLLLSNIDSNTSTKIALNDVFPTLQSGKTTGAVTAGTPGTDVQDLFVGGGSGSSAANTDKSILIFKGLKVSDTNGALKIQNDVSTADSTKQNVVVSLDQRQIKLNVADNSTAEFLSEVGGSNPLDLADANHSSGILPVTKGGSGAATFTDGGLIIGNGTGALQSTSVFGAGSLLIGAGGSAAPSELTVGLNNYVLIADSTSPLGVKWGKPTISTASFTADLNMNNNNIDLGTGYLTGSGAGSAGISLSTSSDYVYIGNATKFFDTTLNVEGGLTLGNSAGNAAQTIKQRACTNGASPTLTIEGSTNLDNNAGGALTLKGGAGQSNGDGGVVFIEGGVAAGTGTHGSVTLKTNNTVAVVVDDNQDVMLTEDIVLNQGKTMSVRGNTSVIQATSLTTAVTLNATAGIITLHATALSGHDSSYFTFNNTTINQRSIIMLTTEVSASESAGAGLVAQVANRQTGSCQIRISNTGNASTSTTHSVHFLIINEYV